MRLEKRSARLLAGSALVLAAILALPARRRPEPAPVVPATPPPAAEDLERAARLSAQAARARALAGLAWTDPFAPAAAGALPPVPEAAPAPAPVLPPAAPVLTAISIHGADRRAVIDRRIVAEGERLASGHVVARITARSVTLLREQEELTLCLGDEP